MLDSDTTTFLTQMRESIESKIDASASEGREAVRRVETTLSSLSREVGEQTMALLNHKAEDDRQFNDLDEDVASLRKEAREDNRTRMQKAAPIFQGGFVAGLVVAVTEWFKNGGSQ